MLCKNAQLSLFEAELADASMDHLPHDRGLSCWEIHNISNQLYEAGFRYVGKHARVVSEYEWEHLTRLPFVSESNRTDDIEIPAAPKCGWCRDTGMAPWIMGDFMRTCRLCEKGQEMRDLGYGTDPFLPATVSKEEAEKFLGPLTDEKYESIMEQYSKQRREAL